MEGHELEERIMDFIDKKYDVLVCTNIVESGVDIPNVNTIIVNNAHQFGLSDLHQLRGRVGRSNKKAFCYLLAPPMSTCQPIRASACKHWSSTVNWAAASRLPCATSTSVVPVICWVVSKAALWRDRF
jgi:ERCC4-related helicase